MVKIDYSEGYDEYYLEYLDYLEFEMNIADAVENSSPEELEENICKLGFIKVTELKGSLWFRSDNDVYILFLADGMGWYLYCKTAGFFSGRTTDSP